MDTLWFNIVQWLHTLGLHVDGGTARAVGDAAATATAQLDMPGLLALVFNNLVGNALKYSRKRERAQIHIAAESGEHEGRPEWVIRIADNGVGFNMKYVGKLFGVFQRLHGAADFEGTGIGLANVRRVQMDAAEPSLRGYTCPAFRLDADNRSVHCQGEDIHLADMEYRILSLFVRNPNTFFTANELYQKIWGKDSLGDVRTVQVHIHNLRSKIEPDPAKPVYLCNVWGKGYVLSGHDDGL